MSLPAGCFARIGVGVDMIDNKIGIAVAALTLGVTQACAAPKPTIKPTIVLVHGAFEAADVWKPVEALSQADKDSKMGPAFRVSEDKTKATVDPAAGGELFCNGCNPKVQKAVAAGFVSELLGPLATPVTVSADRFGGVDKIYIHTARDLVVSPALQATMIAATPVRREMTLDIGHAAFAAAPVELAKAIESAAQHVAEHPG
jgi:hypothetical protein